MTNELWSLANIITGFSVAQNLAFAIALGRDLNALQSHPTRVKVTLTVFCVVFSVAYSVAVVRCYRLAMSVERKYEAVWLEVTWGRVICIVLFTIVPVFGLFARKLFRK